MDSNTQQQLTCLELFEQIKSFLLKEITCEFIESTKTDKGKTQNSESIIINKLIEIFQENDIAFEKAGSQQSKDFRNVGNIKLDIEVKKTDSFAVYFNDTCPNENIYYIIFFTGKIYKKTPANNIKPQIIFTNGYNFIKDSLWIKEYQEAIELLKNKYARGDNKKILDGIMEVYPRPTYKANIKSFLR